MKKDFKLKLCYKGNESMVWSDLEKDYCTCVNGKLYFEGLDKSSWIKIVQSSHPNETLEHLDKLHIMELANMRTPSQDELQYLEKLEYGKRYSYKGKEYAFDKLIELWMAEEHRAIAMNKVIKPMPKIYKKDSKVTKKIKPYDRWVQKNRLKGELQAKVYKKHAEENGWNIEEPVKFTSKNGDIIYQKLQISDIDGYCSWALVNTTK